MSTGKFPKPYVSDVPNTPDPMTEHVNYPTMGIGARPSGLPKESMNGIKSIEHVGGSGAKKG